MFQIKLEKQFTTCKVWFFSWLAVTHALSNYTVMFFVRSCPHKVLSMTNVNHEVRVLR